MANKPKTTMIFCRVDAEQLERLTQLERESGLTRSEILRDVIDRLQVCRKPAFYLTKSNTDVPLLALSQ